MPTTSTEHSDVATTQRIINECLKATGEEVQLLKDPRQFYWRVLYYCNAQIIPSESSFCYSGNQDPFESMYVSRAIAKLDHIVDEFCRDQPSEERTLFYKRVHGALYERLDKVERAYSTNVEWLLAQNHF